MLNQVLKVFSGTCQHSVEVLPKSVTFLDFRISQGSVATYCRRGGNFCDVYIKIFFKSLVKKNWKSVYFCQSYYQTSRCLAFLEHGVVTKAVPIVDSRTSLRITDPKTSHIVQNC